MPATAAPAAPSAAPAGQSAGVTIRVIIPGAASAAASRRHPAYVSAATNSLSFAQGGSVTTVVPLGPSSPDCSAGAGGARTCTVNANATPGKTKASP